MLHYACRNCIFICERLCTNVVRRTSNKFTILRYQTSSISPGPLVSARNYSNNVEAEPVKFLTPLRDEHYQKKLDEVLQDPSKEKQYKIIKLEYECLIYSGIKAPSTLRARDWLTLLSKPTKSQRRKTFEYLWQVEMKDENNQVKRKQKSKILVEERNKLMESINTGGIVYGLKHTTMHLRIYPKTMNQFYHNNMTKPIMFGPNLVIDMGYETDMTDLENSLLATQLVLAYSFNRIHPDPMYIHFCNSNMTGKLLQRCINRVPQLMDPDFPINVTSNSYLDLFHKKDLVYLTPHANKVMGKYDHDKVYIIGGIVDKVNPKPLTLAKAKKEGIEMQKFPLDSYLHFGAGSGKSLTINQCLSILLELRDHGDWEKALVHVPRRKLKEYREHALDRRLRYQMSLGHE